MIVRYSHSKTNTAVFITVVIAGTISFTCINGTAHANIMTSSTAINSYMY